MSFKFQLNQVVEIGISGEVGHVKGRAEYSGHINGYQVHYKSADGRAQEKWFDEDDIVAVEDERSPGMPVFCVNADDIPAGAVIEG
ncbi:hypothetical protein C5E04_18755 [Pectobacterium parmentieri]|uniref:hypothetical protein n=1 Tax=Pectobacterium parmentieri TaxID=1905730 RepID=UPI000EAF1362|nr:hypothetical protein [Pectobacterium parmentieri]RKO74362.1 hypothetical protein C5E04_18755 [Pectobacterium parmentieri]